MLSRDIGRFEMLSLEELHLTSKNHENLGI